MYPYAAVCGMGVRFLKRAPDKVLKIGQAALNILLSGFPNPLTCHGYFTEKVHPLRDALVQYKDLQWHNAVN